MTEFDLPDDADKLKDLIDEARRKYELIKCDVDLFVAVDEYYDPERIMCALSLDHPGPHRSHHTGDGLKQEITWRTVYS